MSGALKYMRQIDPDAAEACIKELDGTPFEKVIREEERAEAAVRAKEDEAKNGLSAAIVRAAERFYQKEENVREFEAWRKARSSKHEKEAKEAC